MANFIYQWIDFLWLPIGVFAVHKAQRWIAFAFILTCLLTLRMQIELVEGTGRMTGFVGLLDSSVHSRGMVIYSIIIMLFLVICHYSPNTRGIIFFAASISIYIFAFLVSMVLMAL